MSNLGEYLQMTTEAKELGGVDFYKENHTIYLLFENKKIY